MITINICGYEIQIDSNTQIWLRNPDGEGMLLTSEKELKEMLDKFWEYHF